MSGDTVPEQRSSARDRRSPRPSSVAVVLSAAALVPVVLIISLSIGATVQLWTNPGSSLGWKLFFPVVTTAGLVGAALTARRQRQRGWSPTACTLTAEGVLLVLGLIVGYAFTTAPN